jgi:hypothetical protein
MIVNIKVIAAFKIFISHSTHLKIKNIYSIFLMEISNHSFSLKMINFINLLKQQLIK